MATPKKAAKAAVRNKARDTAAVKGRSRKNIPGKLKLKVGKEWPTGITCTIEPLSDPHRTVKAAVIATTALLTGGLFTAVTVQAMVTHDQARLDSIVHFTQRMLVALLAWALVTPKVWKQGFNIREKVKQVLKE